MHALTHLLAFCAGFASLYAINRYRRWSGYRQLNRRIQLAHEKYNVSYVHRDPKSGLETSVKR